MWQESLLVRYLWISSPLLQSLVVAVMIRHRLHREFPWFFSYSVFASVTNLLAVSLFLGHFLDGSGIGYVIFIQELGCMILRFAVIYELFEILIRPYPVLTNTAYWLFRIGFAVLILVGVVLAASYSWAPNDSRIATSINVGDRTADVIQCGILALLVLFSKYMRLSWRDFAFGIAIGLGIYAAVDLAIASILATTSKLSVEQQTVLVLRMTVLSMSTYLFCILIWLVYALLPERVPKAVTAIPEHDLEAWHHELQRLLQK
ncbi:MAG TPA: hypothetical protein VMT53_25530 [Terriglobales bacterium]|nr:hypothetical protein [Terriglobales bacterium]